MVLTVFEQDRRTARKYHPTLGMSGNIASDQISMRTTKSHQRVVTEARDSAGRDLNSITRAAVFWVGPKGFSGDWTFPEKGGMTGFWDFLMMSRDILLWTGSVLDNVMNETHVNVMKPVSSSTLVRHEISMDIIVLLRLMIFLCRIVTCQS